MRYTKIFIVRWADCDVNGHMRNTAYSEYAIDTRLSYLSEHGFPFAKFEELGFGPVILREEIDYFRELRLQDTVEVDFKLRGLSPDGGRFKMSHDYWRPGGKAAARLVVAGGWIDLKLRKLRAPPPELLAALRETARDDPFEELPNLRAKDAPPPGA